MSAFHVGLAHDHDVEAFVEVHVAGHHGRLVDGPEDLEGRLDAAQLAAEDLVGALLSGAVVVQGPERLEDVLNAGVYPCVDGLADKVRRAKERLPVAEGVAYSDRDETESDETDVRQ